MARTPALTRVIKAQAAYDAMRLREKALQEAQQHSPPKSSERKRINQELAELRREMGDHRRRHWNDRRLVIHEKEREALDAMGVDARLSDALQAAAVRTRRLEAVFNAASHYVDGRGDLAALEKAVHKARGY